MKNNVINNILPILISTYGDRIWKQRLEPVGELVQTILSQNTSDSNSGRAYASLLQRFGGWHNVVTADTAEIADAIRIGGLADVKAKYIKSALEALENESSSFDLEFLREWPVTKSREWLIQLPGVGMKTASCVLLFSLHMPAFPVDTHIYRVAKRIGLIKDRVSVDAAHLQLEKMVNPQDIYRCHMLIIEHGRKTCKAQRPLCSKCTLAGICPSYKIFT